MAVISQASCARTRCLQLAVHQRTLLTDLSCLVNWRKSEKRRVEHCKERGEQTGGYDCRRRSSIQRVIPSCFAARVLLPSHLAKTC